MGLSEEEINEVMKQDNLGGRSMSSQRPSFCPTSEAFSNKSNVLLRGVGVCVCGAPMHPMRLDHLCAMYPAVTLPGSLAAGTCGALVLSAQGEL